MLNSANDVAGPVPGHHPDSGPADSVDIFQSLDVLGELPPIRPMLIAVIFDSQPDVLPAHIEEVPGKAVGTQYGDLGARLQGKPALINNRRSHVSFGD